MIVTSDCRTQPFILRSSSSPGPCFSGPELEALKKGWKTQMRCLTQYFGNEMFAQDLTEEGIFYALYGDGWSKLESEYKRGSVYYVREPVGKREDGNTVYLTDGRLVVDDNFNKVPWRYKHESLRSSSMPRRMARFFLRIDRVNLHQLKDMTEAAFMAEGIQRIPHVGPMRIFGWKDYSGGLGFMDPFDSYQTFQHPGLKLRRENPDSWVFVHTFKLLQID